jgi:IS5 family transposase
VTGRSPVDRGKPGSKIHAFGDRQGLPLNLKVTAANVNDHIVLDQVVDEVRPVRQPVGRPRQRPGKLHADKGYDYQSCRQALRERNITARIAQGPGKVVR